MRKYCLVIEFIRGLIMKRITLVYVSLFMIAFTVIGGANKTKILENYGKIPLVFTVNKGQVDSQVKFTTQGTGCMIFFTTQETTFLLNRENKKSRALQATKRSARSDDAPFTDGKPKFDREYYVLKLQFVNANPTPEVVGENRLTGNNNYFIGNNPSQWQKDVPNFDKIRLCNLYNGIDLVYYGNRNGIKYDFVVKPGADLSQILLAYDFGDDYDNARISLNEDGELVITTPLGDIIERKPYCYQEINSKKQEREARYVIVDEESNSFTFRIEEYSINYPLFIDPAIVYSTFLGGSTEDAGIDITVDNSGFAYITGLTLASTYPTTSGAFDESFNERDCDVVVTKLNPSGTELVYSTFIGGSGWDEGRGITIDSSGCVYITGWTKSNDYPTTPGAFDESYNSGEIDAFVTKLNASGSELVYSTFLGGDGDDYGWGEALDESGYVYVTGYTRSNDYPTTPGAFDESFNNGWDVFITKLNTAGTELAYSTYVGGSDDDYGWAIDIDDSGCAYITGYTSSSTFPITPGAFDISHNGEIDVFVTKLNTTGTELVYSTFIGGSDGDYAWPIEVDDYGCAYISGYTRSSTYPTTPGALDEHYSGGWDVFVTKLNTSGTGLEYSTFLGGHEDDLGYGLAVDESGCAYVTGFTFSSTYPITPDAYDKIINGGRDIFITTLNETGNGLLYSTFLGGAEREWATVLVLDRKGDAYITGQVWSPNYPVTPGAFDEGLDEPNDGYVTKFTFEEVPTVAITGTITDYATGEAIAGATVTVVPYYRTATTDSEGRYTIENIPSGSYYTVKVMSPDYGEKSVNGITVEAGNTATVNIELIHNVTISGIITDSLSGEGIAGATVTVTPSDLTSITDDDGRYTIGNIPGVSQYTVTAMAPSYRTKSVSEITVTAENIAIVNIALSVGFKILSIDDIPNDQGKQVRISWIGHPYDALNAAGYVITKYSIWRKVDHNLPQVWKVARFPEGDWDFVKEVPAVQIEKYNTLVPTLADSTINNGMYYSIFFVIAHTRDPQIHYETLPNSGYSVDNMSPQAVERVALVYKSAGNYISWEKSDAPDLSHYEVHRGESEDFIPDETTLVGTTIKTNYVDEDGETERVFYKIAACDFSGNRGVSDTAEITVNVSETPYKFNVSAPYPNPFNLSTTIRYEIPVDCHVELVIYDILARRVKVLEEGEVQVGIHEVVWDGRTTDGELASSGVYLYRLVADEFTAQGKMLLMK